MQKHTYRQDEAQAILRRALRDSVPEAGTFSHAQLRQMAAELGIEADTLDRAAQAWEIETREARARREFLIARRRGFLAHLLPYLLVNTLLIVICIATGARHFWAVWPILGWGIGIVSHGLCALRGSGECFEKEFRQWREDSHRPDRPAPPSEAAA